MDGTGANGRQSDIDWLRVAAFSLLILYHAGMPYVAWDWHVKDASQWPALQEVMRFVNRWRMPLIFVVAGAGIMLSLGRRTPGQFVGDRLKRLLLPLAFGMLVVVPPQVYLERLQQGRFDGPFLAFYPLFFDGTYPAGNFSWHHLWFLAYVLVLTLVLLPAFLWLRSRRGAAMADRWSAVAGRYHLAGAMALPLFAAQFWLLPVSTNRNGLAGDWFGLGFYGALLLIGALAYRSADLMRSIERQRWAALAAGIAAFAALETFYFAAGPVRPGGPGWAGFCALSAINLTAWLIAIMGFARRWARPSAWLARATPAVYPFYILHQTVTVVAAYHLAPATLPVEAKYALVVLASFLGSWVIHAGVIRRSAWLRPLFGMAPEKPSAAAKTRALPV